MHSAVFPILNVEKPEDEKWLDESESELFYFVIYLQMNF